MGWGGGRGACDCASIEQGGGGGKAGAPRALACLVPLLSLSLPPSLSLSPLLQAAAMVSSLLARSVASSLSTAIVPGCVQHKKGLKKCSSLSPSFSICPSLFSLPIRFTSISAVTLSRVPVFLPFTSQEFIFLLLPISIYVECASVESKIRGCLVPGTF